jgi:predicted phage-related endonuclease
MQTATTLTPQDQELRQGRITSSRIVKLYQGKALAVWNDMKGIANPIPDNNRMRFGRKLERAIIEAAAEDKGWARVTYAPGTVVDGRYATTPDAIVTDARLAPERVVEAKNRALDQIRRYDANEATEEETVQTLWHMGVTGIHEGTVCVLLGGNDLRPFDVPWDDETWAGLREIADRFLRDHIDTGRPPPIDGSDAAAEYLRKTFPRDTAPILSADENLTHLVTAYRAASAAFDAAEEAKSLAGNLLRQAIGDAAGIKGDRFSVSYKASKDRTTTDWQALLMEMVAAIPADLLAKHSTTKPGPRSLRVNWKETP